MREIYLGGVWKLEARLREGNNGKGIVIAHSFRNDMDEVACSEAEKFFAERGYTTLSFSFLGHGKSGGRLRELSYENVGKNMDIAIRCLKSKGIKKIGIYAISIGSIAAIESGEKIDAQVFLSPTPLYDPTALLKRYYTEEEHEDFLQERGYFIAKSGSGRGNFEIGREWVQEMENDNGRIWTKYLNKSVPTLIIQGTGDPFYSEKKKEVEKIVSMPNTDFFEVEKADHNFTDQRERDKAICKAFEFFDQNI